MILEGHVQGQFKVTIGILVENPINLGIHQFYLGS